MIKKKIVILAVLVMLSLVSYLLFNVGKALEYYNQ